MKFLSLNKTEQAIIYCLLDGVHRTRNQLIKDVSFLLKSKIRPQTIFCAIQNLRDKGIIVEYGSRPRNCCFHTDKYKASAIKFGWEKWFEISKIILEKIESKGVVSDD